MSGSCFYYHHLTLCEACILLPRIKVRIQRVIDPTKRGRFALATYAIFQTSQISVFSYDWVYELPVLQRVLRSATRFVRGTFVNLSGVVLNWLPGCLCL